MAISERIRHIRKKKAMSLKELGQAVGFPENATVVRISQYESGTRSPNKELLAKLAKALDVSPAALDVPGIEDDTKLLFTLFALEDIYGFRIGRSGSHLYLIFDSPNEAFPELSEAILSWSNYREMLQDGKITNDEYDDWRYNFSPSISKGRTNGASLHKKHNDRFNHSLKQKPKIK